MNAQAWKVTIIYEEEHELRAKQMIGMPSFEFIKSVSGVVYRYAGGASSKVPYTVIRELTENFIHEWLCKALIVISGDGRKIRFIDGESDIPKPKGRPAPFETTANERMKEFIRGKGTGLAIVFGRADEDDERSVEINSERKRGWEIVVCAGHTHDEKLDLLFQIVTIAAIECNESEQDLFLCHSSRARDMCLAILRGKYGWAIDDIARRFFLEPGQVEEKLGSMEWLLRTENARKRFEAICLKLGIFDL